MYKGKLKYWGVLILIALLLVGIGNLIGKINPFHKIYMETNIESIENMDETFQRKVEEEKFKGKFKFKFSNISNEPEVYIGKNLEEREGYVLKKDELYSPFVMFMPASVYLESNGCRYIEMNSPQWSSLQTNIADIFLAVEKDKTWEDLGFSSNVVSGPIKIFIPSKISPYYEEVRNYVEYVLTENNRKNGNTDENLDRVNRIMGKFIESEDFLLDIANVINREYSVNEIPIILAPEHYIVEMKGQIALNRESFRSCKDYYSMVYFNNPYLVTMDFQYKENSEKEISSAKRFFENLLKDPDFTRLSGWRLKDSEKTYSNSSYTFSEYIPGIN